MKNINLQMKNQMKLILLQLFEGADNAEQVIESCLHSFSTYNMSIALL